MEIPSQEQLEQEVNRRTLKLVRSLYTLWHIVHSLQKNTTFDELAFPFPVDYPIDLKDVKVMQYPDHGVALHYIPPTKDGLNVMAATIGFRRIGADSEDITKPISRIKGGGSVLTSVLTEEFRTNLLGKEYQVERRELVGFEYQMSGLNSFLPNFDVFDATERGIQADMEISDESIPLIEGFRAGLSAETTDDPAESLRLKVQVLDFWEPILEYV